MMSEVGCTVPWMSDYRRQESGKYYNNNLPPLPICQEDKMALAAQVYHKYKLEGNAERVSKETFL